MRIRSLRNLKAGVAIRNVINWFDAHRFSKRITTFCPGSVCRFQDSLKWVDLLVLSITPVSHIKLHCGVQSMSRLDGIHEGCRLGNGTNPEDSS
jgi:hypothetical protein